MKLEKAMSQENVLNFTRKSTDVVIAFDRNSPDHCHLSHVKRQSGQNVYYLPFNCP